MIKKILLGAVLIGGIGLLIFGAVLLTTAKTSGEISQTGNGRGRQQTEEQNIVSGSYSATDPFGFVNTQTPLAAGQADTTEWITLNGMVEQADETTLLVSLENGTTLELNSRAWLFATSQGFHPAVGDLVSLSWFYDGEQFEAGQIINLVSGESITLRDSTGRPAWAGGGGQGRR